MPGLFARRLVLRSVRRLYAWSRADPVEEELRGWSWDRPPVKPRAYLGLGGERGGGQVLPDEEGRLAEGEGLVGPATRDLD
ncbi:CRISPR-associated protein Cas4 [Thermogladius sp. KZ2Tp1]|uniref:CRISPR-associated protein Cas4 n=1 Tax=Thermogladius sp. KZ2Tp1 TaxID=3136289 RepID=UPI003DA938AB